MIPSPLFIKNYFVVMEPGSPFNLLKRTRMEEKATEAKMFAKVTN